MEIRDKLGHMSEFSCKYPRGFLVCAFVTHPPYQVQHFTGATSVIDLGIENFRDFKLGFIVYHDGRWGGWTRLGIRSGWAGSNMETWNTGCTAQRLSGSHRVTEWVPGSPRISYGPRNLSDSFFEGCVVRKN